MVYPFVENHNFYCEHQHHTRLWNKVRELGAVFADRGFFDEADDIWYLHRFEVYYGDVGPAQRLGDGEPDRRSHWRPRDRRAQADHGGAAPVVAAARARARAGVS